MSVYAMASGALVVDAVRRTGAKGDYATAALWVPTDDDAVLVSTIALGIAAGRLIECRRSDALGVSGRAPLSHTTHRPQHRDGNIAEALPLSDLLGNL